MIVSYYKMIFTMRNCSFTLSSAQLGGIIFMLVNSDAPILINITNSTFLSSNATKDNTYLGADFSMGGILASLNNFNTLISISNCFFSKTFSRKGIKLSFTLNFF